MLGNEEVSVLSMHALIILSVNHLIMVLLMYICLVNSRYVHNYGYSAL